MNKYWVGSLILLIGMIACQKSETEDIEIDKGDDYFPLAIGKYWEYEVDSILFDPTANGTLVDSSRTLVREIITDTITLTDGSLGFIFEHLERNQTNDPWQIKHVWTSKTTDNQAIRVEDNLQFVKLVFPVEAGKQWDGNAFFDTETTVVVEGEPIVMFKAWSYEILEQGVSVTLDGQTFEDVTTIQNADDENLIERRLATEQYARGVGLIYRELLIVDTQCNVCCNGDFGLCDPIPWMEKAEKGFILRQRLTNHN